MQIDFNEQQYRNHYCIVGDRTKSRFLNVAYKNGVAEARPVVGDGEYKEIIKETAKGFDLIKSLSSDVLIDNVGAPIAAGEIVGQRLIRNTGGTELPRKMLTERQHSLALINVQGVMLDRTVTNLDTIDQVTIHGDVWCVLAPHLRELLRSLIVKNTTKYFTFRPHLFQFVTTPATINGFSQREVFFIKNIVS